MRKIWAPLLILVIALPLFPPGAIATDTGDVHSNNIRIVGRAQFPYGTDLAFHNNLLVAGAADWDGAYPGGVRLFNIANPTKPQLTGGPICNAYHSDVGIWGNYVVQSVDSAGSNNECEPGKGRQGVRIIDISNQTKPQSVGFAETIHGSHNLSVVGDTGLVYVSSYSLGDPSAVDGVSIVDLADPDNPTVSFLEFPGADASGQHPTLPNESGVESTSPGCHDIGVDMDRNLAFCAGITESQIWDITDPRNPVIIEIILNPLINIHHGAYANTDGNILVLGDEFAGAAGGPTGCTVPEAPTGALWFYDISDPRNPVLKSYWSPPEPAPTDDFCTSHFYGVFPDRDYVVSAWYDHGIYVIDFSDPTAPKQIAHYDPEGATFWSAYAHKGYIYANSFAPATYTAGLAGHDDTHLDAGGLYVFELDGYSRRDG